MEGLFSTKGDSVAPKDGAAEGDNGTFVEVIWKVEGAVGEAVATRGEVVTSPPVLPSACGAGTAVKTTVPEVFPADGKAIGEAAGAESGASVVEFIEGEIFGETKGFEDGPAMASGATVDALCEVVPIVGVAVPSDGEVVTSSSVLPGASTAGAGAAVNTRPPELMLVGDDAGAESGASAVEFTKGEISGEVIGFEEGPPMASGATVNALCEVVLVVGVNVSSDGDVVTSSSVVPDASTAGAGAAVNTRPPELLLVGDDAGAESGASVVEFTRGEISGEVIGFEEGPAMASGATVNALCEVVLVVGVAVPSDGEVVTSSSVVPDASTAGAGAAVNTRPPELILVGDDAGAESGDSVVKFGEAKGFEEGPAMVSGVVVEVVCGFVVVVVGGDRVTTGEEVVILSLVLPGASTAGAGAAVNTRPPELLLVGDDAGAESGASAVEFTEGEGFGETKRFSDDRSMAGATDSVLLLEDDVISRSVPTRIRESHMLQSGPITL